MFTGAGGRAGRARVVGGLTFWTEGYTVASPNTLVPVVSLFPKPQTGFSDIDIVVKPLGAGGIAGGIADATTVGGDKRGIRSIDLQLSLRTASNQVAGDPYSALIGGRRNSIRHTGAGTADSSAIVGGQDNYIASSSGTTGVGNFIGGGVSVNIDMNANANPRVYLGGNTVSFAGDTGGSGGIGGANVIFNNGATNSMNIGRQNTLTSPDSVTLCSYGFARGPGNCIVQGTGGGQDSTVGGSQIVRYALSQKTSNLTPLALVCDGSASGSTTNQIKIPSTYGASFDGLCHAEFGSNGDVVTFKFEGTLNNVAGALTLLGSTMTLVRSTAGLAAATLVLGVDAANRLLTFTATGVNLQTVRWTGYVDVIERN